MCNYLNKMGQRINETLLGDMGGCRPLWDCYEATRIICELVVIPIVSTTCQTS